MNHIFLELRSFEMKEVSCLRKYFFSLGEEAPLEECNF